MVIQNVVSGAVATTATNAAPVVASGPAPPSEGSDSDDDEESDDSEDEAGESSQLFCRVTSELLSFRADSTRSAMETTMHI